jgi:hypothetical protein
LRIRTPVTRCQTLPGERAHLSVAGARNLPLRSEKTGSEILRPRRALAATAQRLPLVVTGHIRDVKRLLLVAGSNVGAEDVQKSTRELGPDVEVQVVAPATMISRVDWLTNAEDDARDEAAERADQVADAVPTDDVEASAGDTDPLLAISDAVRTFRPDEIVILTRPEQDVSWLEAGTAESARARFSVPVRHVVVS